MMGNGHGGMGFMMDSGNGWMMGSGMVWMGIWLLLAIAGLAVLVVVLVRLARGTDHRRYGSGLAAGTGTPLHILDQRYARGEIDDDEYHRRRDTLQ